MAKSITDHIDPVFDGVLVDTQYLRCSLHVHVSIQIIDLKGLYELLRPMSFHKSVKAACSCAYAGFAELYHLVALSNKLNL